MKFEIYGNLWNTKTCETLKLWNIEICKILKLQNIETCEILKLWNNDNLSNLSGNNGLNYDYKTKLTASHCFFLCDFITHCKV